MENGRPDGWSEPEPGSPLTPYSQLPANNTFNQVLVAIVDDNPNGTQSWAHPDDHNNVSTFSINLNTVDDASAQRVAAAATSRAARMEEGAEAEAKSRRETLAKATLHYEMLQKVRKEHVIKMREARRAQHSTLERSLSGADRGPDPTPWHRSIHLVNFVSLNHRKDVTRMKETMFDAANKGFGGIKPKQPLATPPNPRPKPPRLVAAKIASISAVNLHSNSSSPASTPRAGTVEGVKASRASDSPRSPAQAAGSRMGGGVGVVHQSKAKVSR